MALTMYMKVTGKNQGEIKGSCDQGGDKKDKILVYGTDHQVEIPRDTHTGLPTGQRIHLPISITKGKDVNCILRLLLKMQLSLILGNTHL